MKRLPTLLLVLLLSFFAYNAYTYHELFNCRRGLQAAKNIEERKIDNDNIGPYTGVGYFMEVIVNDT